MNRNVDYSAQPSYEDYLHRLGGSELRFLFARSTLTEQAPGDIGRSDLVALLTSEEAARIALSFADPDVHDIAFLIHIFEDSASIDALAEVAYWASDSDVGAHDGPKGVDRTRARVRPAELTALLERAQRQGLVWQEPAGMWHVPPHISQQFPEDMRFGLSVSQFCDLVDPEFLDEALAAVGLLEDVDGESMSEHELASRRADALRQFVCDPVKVRAVVAGAPVEYRNQLHWMAQEERDIPGTMSSTIRWQAGDWAVRHLLAAVTPISVPEPLLMLPESMQEPHGGQSASAEVSRNVLEEALLEAAAEHVEDVSVRLLAPVALALKGKHWFIRRPHPIEPYPATVEPSELTGRSVAAVAFASAFMDAAGSGDARLKDPLDIYEQESLLWIQDFAASIGADPYAAPWLVEMLVNAGLLAPATGQPTARALTHWYTADASTRWAFLAAGFLAGRGPWGGEFPWSSPIGDDLSRAIVAMGYPRMAREVVSLAAQLESNQKFYGCCIDGHLQWHCENLCLRNNADGEGMVAWLSEQAEILGILTAGHSSWQALAIISAMHDIWLTGQHVGVGRTAELIAEYAAGQVPTADEVHISRLERDHSPNERLSAELEGVPSNEVTLALDFIGSRLSCATQSQWIISEESLRRAADAVDGDVEVLFSQLGPLLAGPMKLVLYAALSRLAKTEQLYDMFARSSDTDPAAESGSDAQVEGGQAVTGHAGADEGAASGATEGPDSPDDPEQLPLF